MICNSPDAAAAAIAHAHACRAAIEAGQPRPAYTGPYILSDIDFTGADLRGANFTGVNFVCARLAGTDLTGADLRGALLGGALLGGAWLTDTRLLGADLRGANLRGARLAGTDLRSADLRGAYLDGADFTGARLAGVRLTGASLIGARGIVLVGPIGADGLTLRAHRGPENKIYIDVGEFEFDYGDVDTFRAELDRLYPARASGRRANHRLALLAALALAEAALFDRD
jgi:hypothetical protein